MPKITQKSPLKTPCKCHIKPKNSTDFHVDNSRKDGFSSRCKRCRMRNKQSWYSRQKVYKKEIYSTNDSKRLSKLTRSRIYESIKSNRSLKNDSTLNILGCSWLEYKSWIESQFTAGMSYDLLKSRDIHIDHIIPISFFNLLDPIEFKKAFHFTNTRPLWKLENLSKGKKIIIDKNVVSFDEATNYPHKD